MLVVKRLKGMLRAKNSGGLPSRSEGGRLEDGGDDAERGWFPLYRGGGWAADGHVRAERQAWEDEAQKQEEEEKGWDKRTRRCVQI